MVGGSSNGCWTLPPLPRVKRNWCQHHSTRLSPSFSDDWKGRRRRRRRRRGEHLQLNAPFLPSPLYSFSSSFPSPLSNTEKREEGKGGKGAGLGKITGTDLLAKLDIFFARMLGPAYVFMSISHTDVLTLGDFHSPPCLCVVVLHSRDVGGTGAEPPVFTIPFSFSSALLWLSFRSRGFFSPSQ